MSLFRKRLTQALEDNQLTLDSQAIDKLSDYLEKLLTWNKVFNLTNITDPKEMVFLHIIDSLLVKPYVRGPRCLDVGSGAGLPGIPLAIADTSIQWTVLDKNSKKTRFLTQMVAELQLPNVTVIHHRCEDFHPAIGFDTIFSRAFGSLALFAETTKHLLTKEGSLMAMKGRYPQEELDALPVGVVVEDIIPLTLKGIDVERHLVSLKSTL